MRRGKAAFGELIRRRLVLADVLDVGLHADLVQRAAKERGVRGEPLHINPAGREQKNAIGRGGQVVLSFGAGLQIGTDAFAGLPKVENRVTDLLHLPPKTGNRQA